MKRGISPVKIILAILVVIAALIISLAVKLLLPVAMERFSGILFWGVFMLIAVPGVFLVGRFAGR